MSDERELAQLHRACLPTSSLGWLGVSAIEKYYRFVRQSEHEKLFIEKEGALQAAAVLSLAPKTLMQRFFSFCLRDVKFLLSLPFHHPVGVCRTMIAILDQSPGGLPDLPEVVQIFTAENMRGQGLGGRLLATVEDFLRSRGINEYSLKTEDLRSNRAVSFYLKKGFSRIMSGNGMIYFRKLVSVREK